MFGKVIDGMLTLRKIENVPTGPNNRPKLAVKIVGALEGFVHEWAIADVIFCTQNAARCDVYAAVKGILVQDDAARNVLFHI